MVKFVYYFLAMAMTPLGSGIWTLSFPFQTCGIHFGTRTTIVQTPGGLALISPGPFTKECFESVDCLGRVVALVAPNAMHHLFLKEASARYPEATIYVPRKLLEKRPDLAGSRLHEDGVEVWGEVLQQQAVEGVPELEETVFCHPASKTLILTDLAFNFAQCEHWLTRNAMRLNGSLGRFGPSRLFRAYFLRDEKLFSRSLKKIFSWSFETVVVAHGEILTRGARQEFERAYRGWLE